MKYHNYQPSIKSSYDKHTHIYTEIHLAGKALAIYLQQEEWQDAVRDAEGCTMILPVEFAQNYYLFKYFWQNLIDTGRLTEIEYIKNVDASCDRFEKMSDNDKAQLCMDCVRIQLDANQQSSVSMRKDDNEDYRAIPYEDLKENHILSIERYPNIENNWNDDGKESLALHVDMDIYTYPTGNAPDTLVMMGDVLRVMDDLPAVIPLYERPQKALKVDLNFWFPEFLRALLFSFQDYIVYGTAPGPDGEAQRLNRILNVRILRPSLVEQMHFMQRNDLNLDTSISGNSSISDELKKIAAIGLSTAVATTAVTALGSAMTGLATMAGPLGLLGLGIWGASKLFRKHNDENIGSEYPLDEDSYLDEGLNSQIYDNEGSLKQDEFKSFHGNDCHRNGQNKETICSEETCHINDKKFKHESEMSPQEIARAQESLNYRRKIDTIVCNIMHGSIDVNNDNLSELSSILHDFPNDASEENCAWLHKIKTYECDYVFRIIEDIQDIIEQSQNSDCSVPFESACPRCAETLDENFSAGNGFSPNLCYALLKSFRKYEKQYREKYTLYTHRVIEEEKVRAEERQNVLYEMSHHIKNLVVSVIDPLENLADNMPAADKFVLETAIKGASMIRQIVFFITNSYRFTIEDFLYDLSNPIETPQALGTLFENTLRASVASMFDKQTHDKYMRMFYPTRDSFISAKEHWYATQNLTDVLCFMEKHMNIKVHIDFESFKNIVIGNTKGSATNLAILYNELTMNMLKALAIVPANERTFTITADKVGEYVCFNFINSSRNAKAISKGYGKTIVTNIVNGFGGNISYNEEEQSFQVKVSLPFYKESITANEVTK